MPTYTNNPIITELTSPWSTSGILFNTITLLKGVPMKAQLEIERIFLLDRSNSSTIINGLKESAAISAEEKRLLFIIPTDRFEINETSSTLVSIDLTDTGVGIPYDYTVGDFTVTVPPIAVGDVITIRRKTISNQSLITWIDGGKLTSNQLNLAFTQNLFLIQEVINSLANKLTVTYNTLTAATIVDGTISTPKLATSCVTSVKISDGAVITSKIGNQQVSGGKLAIGSVAQTHLDSALNTQIYSTIPDFTNISNKPVITSVADNDTTSSFLISKNIDPFNPTTFVNHKFTYRNFVLALTATLNTYTTNAANSATAAATSASTSLIQAGAYATIAAGLAAVANGQYFRVQGSDNVAVSEYRRDTASTYTYIAAYPSAISVTKPAWAGKTNLWCDTFFRNMPLPTSSMVYLNKIRWGSGGTLGAWEYVESSLAYPNPFNGKGLRRVLNFNGAGTDGPRFHVEDCNFVSGDTIHVYMYVIGSGNFGAYFQAWNYPTPTSTSPIRIQDQTYWQHYNSSGAVVNVNPSGNTADMCVLSSTPKLIFFSYTYGGSPALTDIFTYFGATASYTILACWGHTGPTRNMEYPVLNNTENLLKELSVLQTTTTSDVLATNNRIDNLTAGYLTAVTGSNVSVVLGSVPSSTALRTNEFWGWGQVYRRPLTGFTTIPSFNAITIADISRGEPLVTSTQTANEVNIIITTASSLPQSNTYVAAPIAIGKSYIDKRQAVNPNVTILLTDPVTGQAKTLTDADIQQELFIGYYTKNSSVTPIIKAVTSNSAGAINSSTALITGSGDNFYVASAGSFLTTYPSGWQMTEPIALSNNIAFTFKNITNPVLTNSSLASSSFAASVLANMSTGTEALDLILPPFIYGVQGQETNLYFDNLIMNDASSYNWDLAIDDTSTNYGKHKTRSWSWIVSTGIGGVTGYALTVTAKNKVTGTTIASGITKIRTTASAYSPTTAVKVLLLGDSLLANNVPAFEGEIIALNNQRTGITLTLMGSHGISPQLHEGNPGWKITDYTTVGRDYFKFTCTGSSNALVQDSTQLTNNGKTFVIRKITIIDSSNFYLECSRSDSTGTPILTASNLVISFPSNQVGTQINYSSAIQISGNPFWYGGISFSSYLSTLNQGTPDIIIIGLGINDVFGELTDANATARAETNLTALDSLIDSIKLAAPNVRIGLMCPTPPADQNAFGVNYGLNQPQARYKRNILLWSKVLINKYLNKEISQKIYLVSSNLNLDTVYGYPTVVQPVNARSPTITETVQIDSVHPNTAGFNQLADSIYSFIRFVSITAGA